MIVKCLILSSFIFSSLLLSACERLPNNDRYTTDDLGKSYAIEYATVRAVREVSVIHKKKEGGALAGAAVGAGAGSYGGDGTGSAWAAAGGAIAGALIGNELEKQIRDTKGHEYVLAMRDGKTKTIVLENDESNPVLNVGDKAMLQYCDAGNEYVRKCASGAEYQRLIKVDEFPPEVQNTKKKKRHSRNTER